MIPWKERLTLYPAQAAAIDEPEGDAIIEASPKAGKTRGCLQWFIEETERKGIHATYPRHLWVAPTYSQAKIAFRRAYQEVLDSEEVAIHKTEHTITLPSGAVLVFASGDRHDNLYGEDYFSLVVDEGSRLSHDAWIAAQSTLNHTGGRIRIITNVTNRRNWAYRLAREVERGRMNGWAYARLTQDDAIAAGVVDPDDDARARDRLPDDVYRTLYYAEVGDDGAIQLDIDKIERSEIPEMVTWARAWDLATTEGGDWTVGVKVAGNHEGFWIADIVRERVQPEGVINLIRQTATVDGPAVDQVVEEEKGSSGRLFLETIRQQLDSIPTAGPVWPAGVEQNKIIRAWPMAVAIGQGRYAFAPDFDSTELMAELESWPDSRYDDQTDALAHAHNHLAPLVQGLVGSGWVPGQG